MDDDGHRYVVGLEQVGRSQHALVGGKAAGLGELLRLGGVQVPPGVCVTTTAFEHAVTRAPGVEQQLGRLASIDPADVEGRRSVAAELRRTIEQVAVPAEVADALAHALGHVGGAGPWAVRSSATAEDQPTASFAGQHDSFLDVIGTTSVLEHVRRCWASLFSDRAVVDRNHHGIGHHDVHMAVVVQRMVDPIASGVLFTADPATSNRRTCVVEAASGLGEALVAGRVDADTFRVREGEVIARSLRATQPTLRDEQVLELARLGRRIASAFGAPQDVEWCVADDGIWVVQSRPITTLFPVPAVDDDGLHVYISVGHQQMMTDAMRPLGWSMFQRAAGPPMHEAGGRLFVDVTAHLSSATMRERLLAGFGASDPLIGDAVRSIVERGTVPIAEPAEAEPGAGAPSGRGLPGGEPTELDADPTIVAELIERSDDSIEALERSLAGLAGPALFDAIEADLPELKARLADPESYRVIMAGTEATWWLNDTMAEWLGVANAADVLTRSVPDNVTSQMGLALLDVADVVRLHPEAVELLERFEREGSERRGAADGDLLAELGRVEGGAEVRAAVQVFLDRYGMRCVGEIDLTRPRWSEQPDTLVPLLLGHVRNAEPGAGARRFEQGRRDAEAWRAELLGRVGALPDGAAKADRTATMIDRVRTFAGYREHPKYGLIRRFWVYKQALWAEAERMVAAGVLRNVDDVTWLTFDELRQVARSGRADHELIERRRAAFRTDEQLTPPRVMTSEGEVVTGTYRREHLPEGALAGLGVSAGTVEGRARVLHDLSDAEVDPGDVLVTRFTDPSWSPLFVAVAGLVTEVGGLMTHGAVIAREYGLPAVVGVEHATELIRDGQRIRVHGAQGYVELLD